MKNHKLLQAMAYFTILLGFISVITLFTWTVKNYEPIKFNKIEVQNKVVKRGDYVTYRIDYCKESSVVAEVSRSFVDGVIYQMPHEPQPFLMEGCHIVYFQVYIPKALPQSTYKIVGTYTFKVNPIRSVDVLTETDSFEVI